jgi:hypothetical protein
MALLDKKQWFATVKYDDAILSVIQTSFYKFCDATKDQKYGLHCITKDGTKRPICNGAGPAGFGWLVPDKVMGISVTIPSDMHDWGYQWGTERHDKEVMDETYRDNIDRVIRTIYEYRVARIKSRHKTKCIEKIQLLYAKDWFNKAQENLEEAYFKAVSVWGKSAFWDKEKVDFTYEQIGVI